jgi:PAS domain-containing protein
MADRGAMADALADKGGTKVKSASGEPELLLDTPVGAPRTPRDFEPLVTSLGGGTLDFTAMLAIADVLPVMIAYVDASCTYRFVNKPLAEWLGLPRGEILGRHMREVLGEDAYEHREPMFRAALKGERNGLLLRSPCVNSAL